MKNIKLVVFDMDGTLYDLNDVVEMNYKMQLDFYSEYSGLSNDKTIELFEENGIFPRMTEKSKSATEFFSSSGVNMELWKNYRNEHFDVSKINIEKAVKNEVISQFKRKYKTILLTSNSYENVCRVLEHIKIAPENFDMCVCSDKNYPSEVFNKLSALRYISEKMGVGFEQMLSVGDRFNTDVKPMLELGGKGIVVNAPKALKNIFCDLESGGFTEGYSFYS